jgi:hypothetical protein
MKRGMAEVGMKRVLPIAVIAVALAALIMAAQEEDKAEEESLPVFVGERRCKVCHLATFKAWEKTAHAHAFETLTEEERKNPICIACHTTGYGAGGYGSKETVIDLTNVQCESCHGPGSLYSRSSVMRSRKDSEELGLVKIDAAICTRCHNENSPTFRVFDYAEFLKTGTH